MTTVVVLGRGAIVPKLAPILKRLAGVRFVGLVGNSEAYRENFGNIPLINPIRFREAARLLKSLGTSRVAFIGYVGSFDQLIRGKMGIPDRLTVHYCLRVGYFSPPHAYLAGIKLLLRDLSIDLVSPIKLMPELRVPNGFFLGSHTLDDIKESISLAQSTMRQRPIFTVRQSCIVDSDKVIVEVAGTDHLLYLFKAENKDARSSSAILVKFAVPGLGDIDTPVIGLTTVRLAYEHGLKGIAIGSDQTIVLDQAEIVKEFSTTALFIYAA